MFKIRTGPSTKKVISGKEVDPEGMNITVHPASLLRICLRDTTIYMENEDTYACIFIYISCIHIHVSPQYNNVCDSKTAA